MYFLPLRNIVFVFIELFYCRQLILFAYVENGFWKMKHWWWCSSGQVANVDGTQYNAGEWVAASFYKALWRFISSECFFCLYPLRTSRKSFRKRFEVSAHGESHFPNGLWFPRIANVISRMVCDFRARRKSFPERFGVSAHGESRFLNGLVFPRMAKVISRMVWSFRAWRKSLPKWFGISAHGESCCSNGLEFLRLAKVISRMVWSFRRTQKHLWEVGLYVAVYLWLPIIFLAL